MKAIIPNAAIGWMILQCSCLTTLQPVVTPETIITEDRITGNWNVDGDIIEIEKLEKSPIHRDFELISPIEQTLRSLSEEEEKADSIFYSKTYGVTFKKDNVTYYMVAALTRISNQLFMNLQTVYINDPDQPEGSGYEFNYSYLSTFTTARLEIKNNNMLVISFPDGEYLKEQIRNNRIRIKHESDPLFGTFLITASSFELQQFLQKYGHDERLFSSENSITLTRKVLPV